MISFSGSGLTPTRTLSARRSVGGTALPPPRSVSPRKSGISGTARRSNGIDIFSPSKATLLPTEGADHENLSTPTPLAQGKHHQRLVPSPDKRPLTEVVPNGEVMASTRQTQEVVGRPVKAHDTREIEPGRKERERRAETNPATGLDSYGPAASGTRSEFAADGDLGLNPMGDDEIEEFLSGIDSTIQNAVPGSDNPADLNMKVVEKAKESVEPTRQNGRPGMPADQRTAGTKRKSVEVEEQPIAAAAKKPRARKGDGPKSRSQQQAAPVMMSEEFAPRRPATAVQEVPNSIPTRVPGLSKDPNTHLSRRQKAELDQIIEKVKARPGKLKTLYILKRDKSKKSGTDDVRSGRAVVKPVAYWNAEQCVHDEGAAGLEFGARIPLSSVREISGETKKTRTSADSDDDAECLNDCPEDGHEEAWERDIGVFRGQASVWSQPDQTILEETEETDLAYHPSSMLTREVPGSGFKFAKLVSMPFFGSGIVDLPPGTVKMPKNSKMMHMCFYVTKGRVTVKIGPMDEGEEVSERFSVGKGAVFQVPRGKSPDFCCCQPFFSRGVLIYCDRESVLDRESARQASEDVLQSGLRDRVRGLRALCLLIAAGVL